MSLLAVTRKDLRLIARDRGALLFTLMVKVAMEITVGGEEPFTIVGPPWESLILTVPYEDDALVPVSIEAFDASAPR